MELAEHTGTDGRRIVDALTQGSRCGPAEAALALAAAGLQVLPIVPGSKRPLTPNGLADASRAPDQLAGWWRRWPDANVAIATGGSGVDVLDVDRRQSGNGFDVLLRLLRAGHGRALLVAVATPNEGLHLYYPAVSDRPQRPWALTRHHVDFRGTGGYVLVPPSSVKTASGVHPYRVVATGRAAAPLDALAARHLLDPRPRSRPTTTGPRRPGPSSARGIATWLSTRSEGTRNNALFWAACRYVEMGLGPDVAKELLGNAAAQAGLPSREVTATIHSAYRHTTPTPTRRQPPLDRGIGR
ncbi:MAG: bifunctional DNA primase/polymerase [Actinomycetota bacterium]